MYLLFTFNIFFFQYVSLLRPPVTEGSMSGSEVIDKTEWKQVRLKKKPFLLIKKNQ